MTRTTLHRLAAGSLALGVLLGGCSGYKHARSASRYPDRLRARGESPASVRMPFCGANGKRYETAKDWHDAIQAVAA